MNFDIKLNLFMVCKTTVISFSCKLLFLSIGLVFAYSKVYGVVGFRSRLTFKSS